MSSNMRLKRVCQLESCGKVFIAQKTSTKFCSLECGQKAYKIRMRKLKMEASNKDTQERIIGTPSVDPLKQSPIVQQDLIDIKMLSAATGFSRSTIFRLIGADPAFPRIQTSKRNVKFQKDIVIKYLTEKYGNL